MSAVFSFQISGMQHRMASFGVHQRIGENPAGKGRIGAIGTGMARQDDLLM
jgi:hypothetical protein